MHNTVEQPENQTSQIQNKKKNKDRTEEIALASATATNLSQRKPSYITILTRNTPIGKTFTLSGSNGTAEVVVGNEAAYDAFAYTVQCEDLVQFETVLSGLNGNQAVILGYVAGTENVGGGSGDNGSAGGSGSGGSYYGLLGEKDLRERVGWTGVKERPDGLFKLQDGFLVAGRFKSNFIPSSIVLLDRDMDKQMPVELVDEDYDAWWYRMTMEIPVLKGVGRLVVPSSKSRVVYAEGGEAVFGDVSSHTYIQLDDPEDYFRFTESVVAWALDSNNLSYNRITKIRMGDGSFSERSLRKGVFDTSVFSPERIVYEGAPTVLGEGLQVGDATYTRFVGSRVHTRSYQTYERIEGGKRRGGSGSRGWSNASHSLGLLWDMVIHSKRGGDRTVREIFESGVLEEGGKYRCDTPFRDDSVSENAFMRLTQEGYPCLHDNGLQETFHLDKSELTDLMFGDVISGEVDSGGSTNVVQQSVQQGELGVELQRELQVEPQQQGMVVVDKVAEKANRYQYLFKLLDNLNSESPPTQITAILNEILMDYTGAELGQITTAMIDRGIMRAKYMDALVKELRGKKRRMNQGGDGGGGSDDGSVVGGVVDVDVVVNASEYTHIPLPPVPVKVQSFGEFQDVYIFVKSENAYFNRKTGRFESPQAFNTGNSSMLRNFKDASMYEDPETIYAGGIINQRTGGMIVADDLTYFPGSTGNFVQRDGVTYLNTWKQTSLLPVFGSGTGDEGVKPWLDLWKYIVDSDRELNHILDCLAFTVQQPAKKINHAIVIGSGAEGIGKDTVMKPFKAAVGATNCRDVLNRELDEHYEDFAVRVKVMIFQEIFKGNKRDAQEVENRMKNWIAAPPDEVRLRQFGKPTITQPNLFTIIMFTNHKDALHLGARSRRYFCTWSDKKPPGGSDEGLQAEYFNWMHDWLDVQGGNEKVYGYLLERDLSHFNPSKRPPNTEYRELLMESSKGDLELMLEEVMVEMVQRGEYIFVAERMMELLRLQHHERDVPSKALMLNILGKVAIPINKGTRPRIKKAHIPSQGIQSPEDIHIRVQRTVYSSLPCEVVLDSELVRLCLCNRGTLEPYIETRIRGDVMAAMNAQNQLIYGQLQVILDTVTGDRYDALRGVFLPVVESIFGEHIKAFEEWMVE